MPGDLVQVEEGGEEVVLVLRTESARLVAGQAAGRGGSQVSEHRHELGSGPLVLVDRCVVFAVDAAVDGMDQAVALAAAGTVAGTWW